MVRVVMELRCKKYHGEKEKEYLIHIMIRDFHLKKYHNINSESKTLNLKQKNCILMLVQKMSDCSFVYLQRKKNSCCEFARKNLRFVP